MTKILYFVIAVLFCIVSVSAISIQINQPTSPINLHYGGENLTVNVTILGGNLSDCIWQYNGVNNSISCGYFNSNQSMFIGQVADINIATDKQIGEVIDINVDSLIYGFNKSSGDDSTHGYLQTTTGVNTSTCTFGGTDYCEFDPAGITVLSGATYYLLTNGNGASVNHKRLETVANHPQESYWFNYTTSINNFIQDATNFNSIMAVNVTDLGNIGGYANGSIQTTINASDYNNNSVTAWAKDDGVQYSNTSTWYYNVWIDNYSFDNSTLMLEEVDSLMEIFFPSSIYTSISAIFNYNNTDFATTTAGSGDNRAFAKAVTTPAVSGATNIPYYWIFQVSNDTNTYYINTSFYNQSVSNIAVDGCSAYSRLLINYTLYDEDSRVLLSDSTMKITTKIGNADLTEVTTNGFNNSDTNPTQVCISQDDLNGTSYRLDVEVSYNNSVGVLEYHNIQNYTVTNDSIPINVDLYDLAVLTSQEFLITYKDSNFIPVDNAIIELNRQYLELGEFLTVEAPRTDTDGRTIGHFVLNDAIYNINVRKNGKLLATFENVRAFCDDIVTGDCRININELASSTRPEDFTDWRNIAYSTSYNDITKTFYFTYLSNDGLSVTANLTIDKVSVWNNETICSKSLTASSGSMFCNIPNSFGNGTAYARVYVDGELVTSANFPFKTNYGDTLDRTRYILAFILVFTLPLIAFGSVSVMLIFFLIGFIVAGSLFLVDLGGMFGPFSAILWLIVAIILVIIKLNYKEAKI